MRKSRIISLLCCTAMLGNLLCACADSKGGDNESSEVSSAVETSEASSQESSAAEPVYEAKYQLSNKNSNAVTKKLYDYICENYGKKIISAQQESTWVQGYNYEVRHIEETTGKYPAMKGFDFMNDDFSGVTERAAEWWMEGGLVTICWHTGVEGLGYNEALKEDPDFDELLKEGSEANKKMLENWDKAAAALKDLQDMGIPVLWRPFHEFDGQWFWWGKGGNENFIKLWQMMYDRYTNEFGLNNLIWVLGYSGEVKDGWYPGDEYCDILGSDTYDNTTNKGAWDKLQKVSSAGKPLAFHECGVIPLPEDFEKDGDIWSFFMCWHTDYIIKKNDAKNLKKIYNSDLVITRDELPKFTFDES